MLNTKGKAEENYSIYISNGLRTFDSVSVFCLLILYVEIEGSHFSIVYYLSKFLDCFPHVFMFGYILFRKSIRNWMTSFSSVFVIQENDGNLQIFKQTFLLLK